MLTTVIFSSEYVSYAYYDNFLEAYNYTFGEKVGGHINPDGDPLDHYRLDVPCSGKISIDFKYYAYSIGIIIYDSNGNKIYSNTLYDDVNFGYAYLNDEINISQKGTYYLCVYGYFCWESNYDLCINFKPNLTTPSNFKVSSRSAASLKLSWNKIANVSGYQLQRKSGGSYKTVTNTTATSATVSNLSTATNYAFRVRAYRTVNGTKYYGAWSNVKAITCK